jgi:hypothetical protein
MLKIGELLELVGANFKVICSATYSVFGALWVLQFGWNTLYLHWSTCQWEVRLEDVYRHVASAEHTLLHVYEGSVMMNITKYSVRTA